jgi:molybdate transport system ATP-binding protein
LDEPLSALDSDARRALQDLLAAYHADHRMTVLMVSHDVPEIVRLAGSVLVMEAGRVAHRPTPSDYASWQGGTLELEGVVSAVDQTFGERLVVTIEAQGRTLRLDADRTSAGGIAPGDRVRVACAAVNPVFRKI